MKNRFRIYLLPLLLMTLVQGCGDPTSSVISDLQIRMASQSPIQQHVRSVVLGFSNTSVRSTTSSEYGTPGTMPHTIDLTELGGSDTRILEVFSLAEGRYDAARLDIDGITVTLLNAARFSEAFAPPLTMEITIQGSPPVNVEPDRKADAVIDFDQVRSITLEGDTEQVHGVTGFSFQPVARLVDLASAGQVSGSVKHDSGTPAVVRDDVALRGYPVTIFQPGSVDTVTVYSDDSGRYTAYFMPAGSYSMQGPPTEETGAWSTENVVVTTASTTRQDIVVPRR